MTHEPSTPHILTELDAVIQQRFANQTDTSYVASLLKKGEDSILKKIAEEACEVVMASKDKQAKQVVYETADLWFHTLVLLAFHDVSSHDVLTELTRRMGISGHEEKASRTSHTKEKS